MPIKGTIIDSTNLTVEKLLKRKFIFIFHKINVFPMALAQISPQKRETIECETKREIFAMELVQKERWQILVFFFFGCTNQGWICSLSSYWPEILTLLIKIFFGIWLYFLFNFVIHIRHMIKLVSPVEFFERKLCLVKVYQYFDISTQEWL